MDQHPLTFGDLLSRLAGPLPERCRCCAPLIVSVVPHTARPNSENRPIWAVLHSITDWQVGLIHEQPLGDLQVDVAIKASAGEVLTFSLAVGRSKKNGELYETSAEVVRTGSSALRYPLAS